MQESPEEIPFPLQKMPKQVFFLKIAILMILKIGAALAVGIFFMWLVFHSPK